MQCVFCSTVIIIYTSNCYYRPMLEDCSVVQCHLALKHYINVLTVLDLNDTLSNRKMLKLAPGWADSGGWPW